MAAGHVKLRTLHIGDNEITPAGVIALCEHLPDETTLNQLFLSDNYLDEEACEAISQALIANNSLEVLSLSNCGITDETIAQILAALAVNEKLKSLHLWGNEITKQGAELLIETLKKHNHVLEDVLLFSNPIDDFEDVSEVRFTQTLQRLLNQNKSLDLIDSLPADEDQTEKELEEIILSAVKDDQVGILEAPEDLEESQKLP